MLNFVVLTVTGSFRRLMQVFYCRCAVFGVLNTYFIQKLNGMESFKIIVRTLEATMLTHSLPAI